MSDNTARGWEIRNYTGHGYNDNYTQWRLTFGGKDWSLNRHLDDGSWFLNGPDVRPVVRIGAPHIDDTEAVARAMRFIRSWWRP